MNKHISVLIFLLATLACSHKKTASEESAGWFEELRADAIAMELSEEKRRGAIERIGEAEKLTQVCISELKQKNDMLTRDFKDYRKTATQLNTSGRQMFKYLKSCNDKLHALHMELKDLMGNEKWKKLFAERDTLLHTSMKI